MENGKFKIRKTNVIIPSYDTTTPFSVPSIAKCQFPMFFFLIIIIIIITGTATVSRLSFCFFFSMHNKNRICTTERFLTSYRQRIHTTACNSTNNKDLGKPRLNDAHSTLFTNPCMEFMHQNEIVSLKQHNIISYPQHLFV